MQTIAEIGAVLLIGAIFGFTIGIILAAPSSCETKALIEVLEKRAKVLRYQAKKREEEASTIEAFLKRGERKE